MKWKWVMWRLLFWVKGHPVVSPAVYLLCSVSVTHVMFPFSLYIFIPLWIWTYLSDMSLTREREIYQVFHVSIIIHFINYIHVYTYMYIYIYICVCITCIIFTIYCSTTLLRKVTKADQVTRSISGIPGRDDPDVEAGLVTGWAVRTG